MNIETGTRRGREFLRVRFPDGRFVTVREDGYVRLASHPEAPDWEINQWNNHSNNPGARIWEATAQ